MNRSWSWRLSVNQCKYKIPTVCIHSLERTIRNRPLTEIGQVERTFDFFCLLDQKRDNMSFHYGKVSGESSDDTLEGQQIRRDPSHPSIWNEFCTVGRWICWPVTFLLLLAILGCEISLMYSRPSSQEIGGEINQIVPGCKYFVPTFVCFAPVDSELMPSQSHMSRGSFSQTAASLRTT
jgi:hypothetical protein